MAVRLTNEFRTVPVCSTHGCDVEGIVHVRGIDARVRGQGIVLERQRPAGIVVRGPEALRRLAVTGSPPVSAALFAAPPIAALVLTRLLRRGRRK